jgi:hypothetical protein
VSKTLLLRDQDDASYVTIRRCRIRDRIHARMCAFELDHALARGVPPDSSAALLWRAEGLLRAQTRRQIGDRVRRIVQTARDPPKPPGICVPISHRLLLAAEPELSQLASRLLDDQPVAVQGIACSAVLLGDGVGPLYGRGRGAVDELRDAARRATEALEPRY